MAHSDEVGNHPAAFRLGSLDLALYRDLSGSVRAVLDRCPHRRLPLSMGRLTEDGSIQCGYHGWCFDGVTGQCTAIPNLRADERIPKGLRVRAFSAAENVAELIGYDLRTTVLAPAVPPTGEEPDQGTTMYQASVADGIVFVWTGSEPPTAMPGSASATMSTRADATGTLHVRAPHTAVADAINVNPGAALGLGALLGAGDEVLSPVVTSHDGAVSVRRERFTYDLPRPSSFEPFIRKVTVATIVTVADTGSTRVHVTPGRRTPGCDVTIALTPLDDHRTVVRWRAVLTGPGHRLFSMGSQARSAVYRWAGRAPDACETLADSTANTTDPGIRALRRARADARTVTTPGASQ